jgi:MFS transporter, YNFM family, putative membrane transport protein
MVGATMPPPATASAPTRRETWALQAGTVAAYADMYLTQPILPVLSREFGVGPARAGMTVSAVVLAIAGSSAFYGPLADALGRRRVIAAALGLLALATAACALAPTLPALVALRALQGLFVPGMTAVSVAYAGDRWGAVELGSVVGGLIGASVVGGLLGRVGAGAIAAHAGWRTAFVVFAALTALAAVGVGRELSPLRGSPAGGLGAAWRGMAGHLRHRRLLGAYLVGATMFFGWMGLFTYLPYLLSAPPFNLSTGLVSSVFLVYAVGVLVSPVAGRLSTRVAPTRLVAIGLTVEGIGLLATLHAALPTIIVGLLLVVAGTFTAQAVVPAFVNQQARRAKGGASALYLTFYYLGGTLGSLLPGLAWERWGWPGVLASCTGAVAVGIAANALLCAGPDSRRVADVGDG